MPHARPRALALSALLASTACSDGTEGTTHDTTAQPDVSAEVIAAADPCDPNPCTDLPELTCSLDRRFVKAPPAIGTCVARAGEPVCSYPTVDEDCGSDGFCTLGACLHVGSVCDYPLDGLWTVATSLTMAGQSETIDPDTNAPDDQCCTDFDDDGVIDNEFGAGMRNVEAVVGKKINTFIADRVTQQEVILVMQIRDLTPADVGAVSGRFDMLGLAASAASAGRFATQAAGDGTFHIKEHSFVDNSVTPTIHLELDVEGGTILGGHGIVGLELGIGAHNSQFVVTSVRGTLTTDPAGRGFSLDHADGDGMQLGGTLAQRDWLATWNGFAREACTCTTWDNGEPIDSEATPPSCNDVIGSSCSETDPLCVFLAAEDVGCPIVKDLMVPDVDTDDGGGPDAMSVGFRFQSVPARVESDGCP